MNQTEALRNLIAKATAYEAEALNAIDHAFAQPPNTDLWRRCPSDPCPFCDAGEALATAILDAEDSLLETS
jgi:hypothetical protein